jgi:hypothetical protein
MNKNHLLINRLSVDKINKLLEEFQKYPSTIQNCIDDMMDKTSWMELKYDTVCTLNDVFGVGYNPTGISSLFEENK